MACTRGCNLSWGHDDRLFMRDFYFILVIYIKDTLHINHLQQPVPFMLWYVLQPNIQANNTPWFISITSPNESGNIYRFILSAIGIYIEFYGSFYNMGLLTHNYNTQIQSVTHISVPEIKPIKSKYIIKKCSAVVIAYVLCCFAEIAFL